MLPIMGSYIRFNLGINNNFPSIEIHHKTPEKKEFNKWYNIKTWNCKEIADIIIQKNCVFLCSNCHSILHTKHFISNINDIFGDKYKSLVNHVNFEYERIISNIQNYDIEKYLNSSLIREII